MAYAQFGTGPLGRIDSFGVAGWFQLFHLRYVYMVIRATPKRIFRDYIAGAGFLFNIATTLFTFSVPFRILFPYVRYQDNPVPCVAGGGGRPFCTLPCRASCMPRPFPGVSIFPRSCARRFHKPSSG